MVKVKILYRTIRKGIKTNKKQIILTLDIILIIAGLLGLLFSLKDKSHFRIYYKEGSDDLYEDSIYINERGKYIISFTVKNTSNNKGGEINFEWNIHFNYVVLSRAGKMYPQRCYGYEELSFIIATNGTLNIKLIIEKGESWEISIYKDYPEGFYLFAPFFGSLIILGIIFLFNKRLNHSRISEIN
jgi:hypothetical protein